MLSLSVCLCLLSLFLSLAIAVTGKKTHLAHEQLGDIAELLLPFALDPAGVSSVQQRYL